MIAFTLEYWNEKTNNKIWIGFLWKEMDKIYYFFEGKTNWKPLE